MSLKSKENTGLLTAFALFYSSKRYLDIVSRSFKQFANLALAHDSVSVYRRNTLSRTVGSIG